MTSMPASRSALATTLAPRSCPSSPGLATTTRMRPCATVPAPLSMPAGPRFAARPRLGRYYPAILPPQRPQTPRRTTARARPRPAPAAARPRPRRQARLPAAPGRQGPQADPAQPAGARLDRRLGPVRTGDPGRRGPVPGPAGPAGTALGAGGAGLGPAGRGRHRDRRAGRPGDGGRPPRRPAGLPGPARRLPDQGRRQRLRPPLRRAALGRERLPGQRAPRRPGSPAAAAPGPGGRGRRRPLRRPPLTLRRRPEAADTPTCDHGEWSSWDRCEVRVIARVLCATAQSEQATLWGEQVGRVGRTAPGFQGAVLLREGAKLLA